MTFAPDIGIHLAVLNLFRESDGSVEITVADARGALAEQRTTGSEVLPITYVEALIIEAADRIRHRADPSRG